MAQVNQETFLQTNSETNPETSNPLKPVATKDKHKDPMIHPNFESETKLMIDELERHASELGQINKLDLPQMGLDTLAPEDVMNETNCHSDSDYTSSEENASTEGSELASSTDSGTPHENQENIDDPERAWRDFDWSLTQISPKRLDSNRTYPNSYTINNPSQFKSYSPKKVLSYNSKRIYNIQDGKTSGSDLKIKAEDYVKQDQKLGELVAAEKSIQSKGKTRLNVVTEQNARGNKERIIVEMKSSSSDSLLSSDILPDMMLVRIKSLRFTKQPNPKSKFSFRLVIHSVTHLTKPSTSIEEKLKKMFLFPFDYHSYVFDALKFDVYDHGSFLNTKKELGRAIIRLNALENAIMNKSEFEGRTFPLEAIHSHHSHGIGTVLLNIKFRFPDDPPLTSLTPLTPFIQPQPSIVRSKSEPIITSQTSTRGATTERSVTVQTSIKENTIEKSDPNQTSPGEIMTKVSDTGQSEINNIILPEVKSFGMLGIVLSQETREAIKEVTVLYHAFFDHGWRLTKLEFFKAYMLLEKYYTQKPNPLTGRLVQDVEKIQTAQKYLKYSMASYGSFLFNWFGYGNGIAPLNAIRINSDRKAVQEFFNLEELDIIAWEFGQRTISVPSYMIVRDPETNFIIISIRGTMNVSDIITDVLAHYETWNGGVGHRGILRSAQYLVNHSLADIRSAVARFKSNAIQVVGHSLGASISAIVTILLREQCKDLLERGVDIHAWNFATAPCCSLNLACDPESLKCIDNFVNENDVIPRLSYGNLMDFKELVKFAASELRNERYKKLSSREKLSKMISSIDDYRVSLKSSSPERKLCIPGNIYYLYKGYHRFFAKDIVCEKSRPDLFTDISLRRNWLFHHFPDRYDKKLKGVIKYLTRKMNDLELDSEKKFRRRWKNMEEIESIEEEGGRVERWMSRSGHF